MLNREDILQKPTLKTKTVKVEEWSANVTIRELTGRQRMEFINQIKAENADPIAAQAWVLTQTVLNENGQRLFLNDDIEGLINTQSVDVLNFLFDQVREISGMTEKAVEDTAKNSSTSQ